MTQVFTRRANTLSRLSVFGAVFVLEAMLFLVPVLDHSPMITGQGVELEQPIPFRHDLHTQTLGIDCRFCHDSVEAAAFAGMPATETCMICHVEIKQESELLEPLRTSLEEEKPLRWNRVYDLPDFAYFDHSIHLAKGIGCVSCHGRVDRMEVLHQVPTLQMDWCLDCHRDPEKSLRPRERLTDMSWEDDEHQPGLAKDLAAAYQVESLLSCSICHR